MTIKRVVVIILALFMAIIRDWDYGDANEVKSV